MEQEIVYHTNRVVEAEHHLLEIITAITNSVQEPLNTEHIARATLDAIFTHFHPLGAYLHTADAVQQALHLLCFHTSTGSEYASFATAQYVPYNSSAFIAQAHMHHEPLLIEDLHTAIAAGLILKDDPLVMSGVRGYLCVPLWFGDQFEGTVTVLFPEVLHAHDPEIRVLQSSGTHIAAALAYAHLHTIVENERTRLRVILDQLPEGILITEVSSGLISYANTSAEHLLGVPLSVLVGTPLDRHLQAHAGTDSKELTMQPCNFVVVRALSEEVVKAHETLVHRPDDSTVIALCSSAPLFSAHGELTGAVLVFQDITTQKSLEQQKNEFLSMMNHELRTPVTAIQGLAELLHTQISQGQVMNSSRSQRALQQVIEQSQHLTGLIEEMLDLSRIEQSHFSVKRTPHDVLGLLTNVVESLAATTRRHHLHLVVEGLEEVESLLGNVDEERIVQVFNNLISNAIKYSPAGGEIEVGLRPMMEPHSPQTAYEVLIWVKDEGIGIPPQEIPLIFKRFHRSRTLDASLSGLGIGLYLVKEIVDRHGGRVWVKSVEGSGSTFYVLFPLNADETE